VEKHILDIVVIENKKKGWGKEVIWKLLAFVEWFRCRG